MANETESGTQYRCRVSVNNRNHSGKLVFCPCQSLNDSPGSERGNIPISGDSIHGIVDILLFPTTKTCYKNYIFPRTH